MPQMSVGQVTRARAGDRHSAAHRDRHERARANHHGRPDARAAAQRPRVLVARAPDDGCAAVGAQQQSGRHAARRRVQRERPPQHLQQLPDRRRRQQRLRHEQPGILEPGDAAGARCHLRVQGRHQQHERGVRPRSRRNDQRGVPKRRQSVSRQRLGISARHEDERRRLLQAGNRQSPRSAAINTAARSAGPSSGTRRSSSATSKGSGRTGRLRRSRAFQRRSSVRVFSASTCAIRAAAPSIRRARAFR